MTEGPAVLGPQPDEGDRAGWDDPPRRPGPAGTAPVLAVDGFEGPLDWLLELARARRIDLARLSIAALVDAFADALEAALAGAGTRPLTLARWGDWLVIAADLALLRSRLVLPAEPGPAEDAAEALRARLLSRAAIELDADWLQRQDRLGREVFGRGRADAVMAPGDGRTADVTALFRACLAALRLPPDAGLTYSVPKLPFWTVADAARRIRHALAATGRAERPMTCFLPQVPAEAPDRELRCRVAVSATLLATLELAREGAAAIRQDVAWGPATLLAVQDRPGEEGI